ncbi:MAG: hypothetical protein BWY91_01463 [bacterium ADurb.BinA028]|nr:MAG: hypothetical protein BWY91_01463 [bacterium ADurb.BinA028]
MGRSQLDSDPLASNATLRGISPTLVDWVNLPIVYWNTLAIVLAVADNPLLERTVSVTVK